MIILQFNGYEWKSFVWFVNNVRELYNLFNIISVTMIIQFESLYVCMREREKKNEREKKMKRERERERERK